MTTKTTYTAMVATIIAGLVGIGLLLGAPKAGAWDGGTIDPDYPNVAWDIDADDDVALMEEAIATMQVMTDRYLPAGTTVTFETVWLDEPDAVAVAYGGNVELSEEYASDPSVIRMSVMGDSAAGYHPPLGQCSPIQFVMVHEMAHVIDNHQNRRGSRRLAGLEANDEERPQLSRYSFHEDGSTNAPEMLANAVASVVCNGGNEIEQAIAAIIGV